MKKNEGITLIALIITVIVMLILVAVSIRMVVNSDILKTSQDTTKEYELAKIKDDLETELANITIDKKYKNKGTTKTYYEYLVEKYGAENVERIVGGESFRITYQGQKINVSVNNSNELKLSNNQEDEVYKLPENWTILDKIQNWSNNVTAITDGTNIVPLPNGFKISEIKEEQTIENGLVIKDSKNNEFVWIPITTPFVKTYTDSYGTTIEPVASRSDTQLNLNKYYGTNYYTIEDSDEYKNNTENIFAYSAHYAEMVNSVNKYDGFYMGRYETTIDEDGVGTKADRLVLTSNNILFPGENSNDNNNPYYYRWWGLYAKQRNANVVGNGSIVQTNMAWEQQWDAMINCFQRENIAYSAIVLGCSVSSERQNSGQARYSVDGKEISDELYNVFDLRGNLREWVASSTGGTNDQRIIFGGGNGNPASPGSREITTGSPGMTFSSYDGDTVGSRLTLYIK